MEKKERNAQKHLELLVGVVTRVTVTGFSRHFDEHLDRLGVNSVRRNLISVHLKKISRRYAPRNDVYFVVIS